MKFVSRTDGGVWFVSATLRPFCETWGPTEARLRIAWKQAPLDPERVSPPTTPTHTAMHCLSLGEKTQTAFIPLETLLVPYPSPAHSSDSFTWCETLSLSAEPRQSSPQQKCRHVGFRF